MNKDQLFTNCLYLLKDGTLAEFCRIGGTGMAIFCPPGEPDMQSSFAVELDFVVRAATIKEVAKLFEGK